MSATGGGSDRKTSGSTTGRASLGQPGGDGPGGATGGVDGDRGLVAHSVFDFMLIELVPMA